MARDTKAIPGFFCPPELAVNLHFFYLSMAVLNKEWVMSRKFRCRVVFLMSLSVVAFANTAKAQPYDSGMFLGCTYDAQQCGMRATRYGCFNYYAERSYLCPNAIKFACWCVN